MENVANFQLDELLSRINSLPKEEIVTALRELYKTKLHSKTYINQNVNFSHPDFDTDIVYKESEYHRSMAGTYLCSASVVNILLRVILADSVKAQTKVYQLKNLLEMLCAGEAKILHAILVKNLSSLYPNITHEMMCESLLSDFMVSAE